MDTKICLINGYPGGSTGQIVYSLSKSLPSFGFDCQVILPQQNEKFPNLFPVFSSNAERQKYRLITRLFGTDGFSNRASTKRLLAFLEKTQPSLINIHNPHPYYLNIPALVDFSSNRKIPIVWTLHDEWILTGRCCSFDGVHCESWKNGCSKCAWPSNYPKALFGGREGRYWKQKRTIISGNPLVTFVAPSKWMKNYVTNPIYGYQNECILIQNPIDLSIFSPSEPLKIIIEKARGRIIIGFASLIWDETKGLNFLASVSKVLDPNKYFLVVAGQAPRPTDEFSKKILFLGRIGDKKTMASFYSSLDFFINVTMQDNSPQVNAESLACGTPIISFDTGGACENIENGRNGFSVQKGDLDSLVNHIISADKKKFYTKACIASISNRSQTIISQQYSQLFWRLIIQNEQR